MVGAAALAQNVADSYVSKLALDIKQANSAFHDAWSKRDLWTMTRLWAEGDYVSAIHPAHALPFLNRDNVRASWKQSFGHNRDIAIHSLAGAVHVVGEVAWVIDSIRLEATQTQTGQPILMNNILTTKIFENHDDKWLLVHYHAHLPKLVPLSDGHGAPTAGEPDSQLPEGVEQVNDAFHHAWSKGDLAAMSEVWAKVDYASAIHPDVAVPFLGWRNVMQGWERIFDRSREVEVRSRAQAKHLSGNIAWVIDSTELAPMRTEAGHPPRRDAFLTTKIFERQEDAWRLVHYHAHLGSSAGQDEDHDHDHAH